MLSAVGLAPHDDQGRETLMLLHYRSRECGKIEGRAEIALHEIRLRPGQVRQLTNFDLAVLRQRANRNDRGLETTEQRDHDFLDSGDLKNRPVAGLQAEVEQGGGKRLREL